MNNDIFNIAELVSKYLSNNLTNDEQKRLEDWLNLSEENKEWFLSITKKDFIKNKIQSLNSIDTGEGWNSIQEKRSVNNKPTLRFSILKYASILIFAILIPTIYIFITKDNSIQEGEIVVKNSNIHPGTSKAMLYMSNGQSITLEKNQEKTIAEEDGTIIDLSGDTLSYKKTAEPPASELYHELITPKGGEYTLTLSDGTIVKLNADSKLRFPVVFTDDIRNVTLEGEAFFKVEKKMNTPFVVNTSNLSIIVLGTEFNVCNYPESNEIRTTLVKGKVRVTDNNHDYTLKAGQQLSFNKESGEVSLTTLDTSYDVSWKDGRLRFKKRSLKEIMGFISRWYNVEIVYENEALGDLEFGCNFNRYSTVYPLLELFQSTGTVHFEVINNKIIVKESIVDE